MHRCQGLFLRMMTFMMPVWKSRRNVSGSVASSHSQAAPLLEVRERFEIKTHLRQPLYEKLKGSVVLKGEERKGGGGRKDKNVECATSRHSHSSFFSLSSPQFICSSPFRLPSSSKEKLREGRLFPSSFLSVRNRRTACPSFSASFTTS